MNEYLYWTFQQSLNFTTNIHPSLNRRTGLPGARAFIERHCGGARVWSAGRFGRARRRVLRRPEWPGRDECSQCALPAELVGRHATETRPPALWRRSLRLARRVPRRRMRRRARRIRMRTRGQRVGRRGEYDSPRRSRRRSSSIALADGPMCGGGGGARAAGRGAPCAALATYNHSHCSIRHR